jgi:MSHA biogenesis protein MshL
MKKSLVLFTAVLAALVTGCSTFDLRGRTATEHVSERRDAAVREFVEHPAARSVRELDTPFLDMKPVPASRVRGPLSLNAASTEFGALLTEAARANGYSVMYSESVDVSKRVSVQLDGVQVVEGLRKIAFLAGYVAIVNPVERTVTVSDIATFTYKLPPHVLQQLQASYKVGGNPVNNDSPQTGSGGGSGSSGSGSEMAAEFVISGKQDINAASLRVLITNMAGRNADVMVSDMGLITVRANAQAQRRVHSFLKSYAIDAMSQVEIEASIVEVSLNDDFEMGIDWSRVMAKGISGSRGDLVTGAVSSTVNTLTNGAVGIDDGVQALAGAAAPSMTAAFTSAKIGVVVNALRQVTDAKVVSNPRILAVNNSPATFFDGTQMPYLGTVTATGGSLDSAAQLSGSASYAVDGISFSVQPSIIDENHVQITLVPVLSSVLSFEKFELGSDGGMLTAPRQANKQSFMKVVAESGKTLILGGIRYSVDTKSDTPAPLFLGSRTRTKAAKEIVILMRATVLPAKEFDPLINESL